MKMNGSIINRVNSIKYLGVIIDHKLNWIKHIAYVQKYNFQGCRNIILGKTSSM